MRNSTLQRRQAGSSPAVAIAILRAPPSLNLPPLHSIQPIQLRESTPCLRGGGRAGIQLAFSQPIGIKQRSHAHQLTPINATTDRVNSLGQGRS